MIINSIPEQGDQEMANLFKKTISNKKVELSVGSAYLKPLSMNFLSLADKLSNPETPQSELIVAFSMLLKASLVDEYGKTFEDVEAATPEELGNMFSIEDFTILIKAIAPKQEDNLGN